MNEKEEIEKELQAAQKDSTAADALIEKYMPFIRREAGKFLNGIPAEGQDELSIAMFAFYECILAYRPGRGAFLHLAAVAIRNRLIDFTRRESRHRQTLSMSLPNSEENGRTLGEELPAEENEIEQTPERMASRQEISHFAQQLSGFGLSLSDVADACPRQERTMSACMAVLNYAKKTPELLERLVRTKKLPLAQLVSGAGVERKTIENHRKYVVAILLAYTNGFEIIRGHLREIGGRKEERQ